MSVSTYASDAVPAAFSQNGYGDESVTFLRYVRMSFFFCLFQPTGVLPPTTKVHRSPRGGVEIQQNIDWRA